MILGMTMMTPRTAETLHAILDWHVFVLLSGTLAVLLARRHQPDRNRRTASRLPDPESGQAKTQQALLHEVNHRVKNNFSSLIGLLQMKREVADDAREAAHLADMESKLTGLARIHDLFSGNGWRPIMLEELCRSVLHAGTGLCALPCRYQVASASSGIRVSHSQAHPLTLVLNELVSNSIKHGSAASPNLMITMTLSEADGVILIEITDNGPGYPASLLDHSRWNDTRGLQIIHDLVASSLRGSIALSNTDGALARITFPRHP